GGAPASRRRPAIVSVPGSIRYQPSFQLIVPSGSRKRRSTRMMPLSPSPPTQRASFPAALVAPKSRELNEDGAGTGLVTGQLAASANVSDERGAIDPAATALGPALG